MTTIAKFLIILGLTATSLFSQRVADPSQVWTGVIELPNDTLTKYVLNDLPGTICALIPSEGKIKPILIGKKVLKAGMDAPKLNATPTLLISSSITKERAGEVGYLSFLSATMEAKDEAKFSITETSHSVVLDEQIDWTELKNRIQAIRAANTNLPANTRFGVIRVSSVLVISYQTFTSVSSSGKIAGWGFSGSGRYLSQKSDESHVHKVGVALAYSEDDLVNYFDLDIEQLGESAAKGRFLDKLSEVLTMRLIMDIDSPAQFSSEGIIAADLFQEGSRLKGPF